MRTIFMAATGLALSTAASQAADLKAAAPVPVLPETCKATLIGPSFNGPIKANPNPTCFPLAGLGDIYVGGALTGYAYTQSNPFPILPPIPGAIDRAGRVDLSNLQGWVQKADGVFQFYAQFGAYASPALGFPSYGAIDQTNLLYTPVPVVFGKIQINDAWSIQGGRMPTLIGSEAPFTFQNLNISRGLLFNQENVINQGVQINYAAGPWTVSLAGTDGFFAGEISWLTGSVAYKIDDANTIGVNGGLNLGRTDTITNRSLRYQYATPLAQQNSGIFNINYTYSNGPWTITPYVQFTNVDADPRLGLTNASTYGGAILAAYAFNDVFSLAGRFEVETQTGRPGSGTTSLLYGPGSSALSFTITPTFTFDRYFVRGEYSRVELYDVAAGLGFGRLGNRTSQDRFMVETGVTF